MSSRSSSPRSSAPMRVVTSLIVLLAAFLAVPASPDKGRWTAPENWGSADGRYAIHLALVRGDGAPDHSRVLYWNSSQIGQPGYLWGQELGWSPGNDDCSLATGTGFTHRGSPPAPMQVFCAGHTQLADGGRLLVHGGTFPGGGAYGERKTALFTAGSGFTAGGWTQSGTMSDGRWYPTAVALIDGRALGLAGLRYRQVRVFGGLRNGTLPPPSDVEGDSVLRYGPEPGGRWDPSVYPAAAPGAVPRPEHRWRHSVVEMDNVSGFNGQVFFGGLGASSAFDDGWILSRSNGLFQDGDYQYQWTRVFPGIRPLPRSDHSAVVRGNDMILFGGREESGNGRNDVWRLRKSGVLFLWEQMTITGSIPARYGHAAVYDTFTIVTASSSEFVRRMLVFGGVAADGQAPSDTKVYELRFDPVDPNLATWHEQTPADLGDGTPTARYWHSLNLDSARVWQYSPTQKGHVALMFGGKRDTGLYSDELWELWLFRDGTMGWKNRTWAGSPPSARALHSAVYDVEHLPGTERLYINGGELQSGGADAATYALEPRAASPSWQSWASAEAPLAGHAAGIERFHIDSRVGEVYDPGTGQWFTDTGATLLQNTYPVSFVVPGRTVEGGRVYSLGKDNFTYYLDVRPQGTPSSDWQKLNIPALDFPASAGVMYQPGKIMVAGMWGGTGRTRTLDTGSLTNPWQSVGSPPGDMVPRDKHNLVILPGGKVLVVGGVNPVTIFRPQLWDPVTGQWTDTLESNPNRLAKQQIVRDYHSTAVLLPDGRVLSAGGDNPAGTNVEIFCPPYLFNADGTPAARPAASRSPQRVRYGAQFSVCLSSVGTISSACLIRPGATTHQFDQNQRYVPLTFTQAYAPGRLIATAPTDSSQAPPGDYLLFVVNSNGVPSLARWLRLGFSWSEGDGTAPDSISLVADFMTCNAVNLTWVASGDDGTSGTASYAELRYSLLPITDANWNGATRVSSQPVPVCGGLGQAHLVTGLNPSTNYYFGIKTSDESGNMSPIGRLKVPTTGQCGGGEARAGLARDEGPSTGSSRTTGGWIAPATIGSVVGPSAAVPTSAGTGLLLEATPGASGLDVRVVPIQGESFDGYSLSADGGVLLQSLDGTGKWSTQLYYDLPPGNRIALCTPEQTSRWVILAPCAVAQIETAVRGKQQASNLDGAWQSRVGDMTALLAAGTPPALLPGDTLSLHYAEVGGSEGPRSAWVLVMERPTVGPTASRVGRRSSENSSSTPTAFALRQNQPNPFAAATSIGFALPTRSLVRLEVFDLLGRRVGTLADAEFPAGEHQVTWDRRTTSGDLAKSGIYYCRIEAGPLRAQRKLVVLP